jgi:carbon monoxide dehydrogenase subunit G
LKLEHQFDVPASPKATLRVLMDAERVVPCMPGAQLTEVVDDRTWKSKMAVKLGPVGMDFLNEVKLVEVDEGAGRVRMEANGRDTRGKGGANATIDAQLVPIEGGTRVTMDTDLRFSGQAAQLGRPNVVKDVSTRLVDQFAECLRAQVSASPEEAAAAVERSAKPISGFRLMLSALGSAIKRLFGRGDTRSGGSS